MVQHAPYFTPIAEIERSFSFDKWPRLKEDFKTIEMISTRLEHVANFMYNTFQKQIAPARYYLQSGTPPAVDRFEQTVIRHVLNGLLLLLIGSIGRIEEQIC